MWDYRRNFAHYAEGKTTNVYMRNTLDTKRRNFTLFLVPTLYSIAKGDRRFITELYGKLHINDEYCYDINRQIISGTIPHNRPISSSLTEYIIPNIYGITLYEERLLSPFHRANRRYYKYQVVQVGNTLAHITFRPKVNNTQLVRGRAIIDINSGRIQHVSFAGEYDMIDFQVDVVQGTEDTYSILPQRCKTDVQFKFMGNNIQMRHLATYHAPETLPDSIKEVNDRNRMDTLRTIQLRKDEENIYRQYDERRESEKQTAPKDTIAKKSNSLGNILWNIGDRLVSSSGAETENASVRLSPIVNPQYISYSQNRGLSYKIRLGARYSWNPKRHLTFQPQLGYNFKIRQFYFYAPLRMTYNPKRNGYAEIIVANGNRISNASVLEAIERTRPSGGTVDYNGKGLDYFNDNYYQIVNNVVAYNWLEITSGLVYHVRKPVNIPDMEEAGMPTTYRSFAPLVTLHISPWYHGPNLTLSYERSFKDILKSNLGYERIEVDVNHLFKMPCMRYINLRGGMGLYTNKNTTYFLDYANFRINHLPEGWDDEWTGQFQLLDSRWYNTSRYYLRAHASYESPLLLCSFLPWIGRYIESERLYLNALSIQHTHAYSEIGYALTTRFISIGVFSSFLNTKIQRIGCKFTFELFRKW